MGLVLDSSLLIEAERKGLTAAEWLRYVAAQVGEAEVGMSAVSVAELAHGIHRADNPARKLVRRAFLDDLKASIPAYDFTAETGELAGRVQAEAARSGTVLPFDDLLIGACALERGWAIATLNERPPQDTGFDAGASLASARFATQRTTNIPPLPVV